MDKIQAAALMKPAISRWKALRYCVQGLKPGFTVLIVGATSASGCLAIDLARALGASRVIGAGRSVARMKDLGLDGVVVLENDVKATDWSSLGDVIVVLD